MIYCYCSNLPRCPLLVEDLWLLLLLLLLLFVIIVIIIYWIFFDKPWYNFGTVTSWLYWWPATVNLAGFVFVSLGANMGHVNSKIQVFLIYCKKWCPKRFWYFFGQFEVLRRKTAFLTKRSLPVKTIASAPDVSSGTQTLRNKRIT